MSHTYERMVADILSNVDGSKEKKDELEIELLEELNSEHDSFIEQGFTEEEAFNMTRETFGDVRHISEQLQQKINPFQRKTMYALALSALLFTFLLYIGTLIVERTALITWLILSVLINVALLLFVNRILKADHKWRINTVLIGHMVVTFVGLGFALSLSTFIVSMYVIYAILLMLIALALIFLNIFFHWDMSNKKKWFHIYNTITGLIIIVLNGLFFIGFSMFSDHVFGFGLFIFIPMFIWIVIYIVQIQLINKRMLRMAIGLGTIPLLLLIGLLVFYLYL